MIIALTSSMRAHYRLNLYYGAQCHKVIPVAGHGGLEGCEMLRTPHCLDNWLTDGDKVVSPMHQPHFTPQKHYFSFLCSFLL
jgi:hypothetical protein